MPRAAQPKAHLLQARSAEASNPLSRKESPAGGGRLSEADLGAKITLLFRIYDDPEHPFSEVAGVLQRVVSGESTGGRIVEVIRRNGLVVSVPESDIIKFKIHRADAVRET